MNRNRKIANVTMAAGLAVVLGSSSVLAAEEELPVTKEETVYVNADPAGEVEQITVSDWLKNSGSAEGDLEDLSDLSGIKNVKGDETFVQDGKKLTWNTDGEDIYYQGTTDKELPVSMKITYYLDGKEIDSSELAGKSGHLRMEVSYTNHTGVEKEIGGEKTTVYSPFLLATATLLPTDKFTNVEVTNGKLISDGSRDVVIGFAAPGLSESLDLPKEIRDEIEIPEGFSMEADVTDCELNSTYTVALTDSIKDLDLANLDGLDSLKGKLDKLEEASLKLVDGSGELYEGVDTLYTKYADFHDGVKQLMSGSAELNSGVGTLSSGARDLADGAGKLRDGAKDLSSGAKTLSSGAADLNGGTQKLRDGAKDLSSGAETLESGLESADSGAQDLKNGAGTLSEGAETLQAGTQKVSSGASELSSGAARLKSGVASYTDGADKLSSGVLQFVSGVDEALGKVTEYSQGVSALTSGVQSYVNGSKALTQGAVDYAAGTGTLANGVLSLQEKKDGLVSGITQITDGVKAYTTTGVKALQDGFEKYSQAVEQLSQGAAALNEGAKALPDGLAAVSSGLASAQKAAGQLQTGSDSLQTNLTSIASLLQSAAGAVPRRLRTRLLSMRQAKWLVPLCRCLTLPLAVTRKRLATPLWVLTLGIELPSFR